MTPMLERMVILRGSLISQHCCNISLAKSTSDESVLPIGHQLDNSDSLLGYIVGAFLYCQTGHESPSLKDFEKIKDWPALSHFLVEDLKAPESTVKKINEGGFEPGEDFEKGFLKGAEELSGFIGSWGEGNVKIGDIPTFILSDNHKRCKVARLTVMMKMLQPNKISQAALAGVSLVSIEEFLSSGFSYGPNADFVVNEYQTIFGDVVKSSGGDYGAVFMRFMCEHHGEKSLINYTCSTCLLALLENMTTADLSAAVLVSGFNKDLDMAKKNIAEFKAHISRGVKVSWNEENEIVKKLEGRTDKLVSIVTLQLMMNSVLFENVPPMFKMMLLQKTAGKGGFEVVPGGKNTGCLILVAAICFLAFAFHSIIV